MKSNKPLIKESISEIFQSMGMGSEGFDILQNVVDEKTILQDFVPVYQSLEWELAHQAWDEYGVLPFEQGNVPFYITSSGLLSYKSAKLLFDASEHVPEGKEITILELGAGSGLYARLLLDHFKRLCEEYNKDYYRRLMFYITDGSLKTINDWQEKGLFKDHQEHVSLQVLNIFSEKAFDKTEYAGLSAVYCNYILDILPFSIIRYNENEFEELYYRTTIQLNDNGLKEHTDLSLEEIKSFSQSSDEKKKAKLLDISEHLQTEMAYSALVDSQKIPDPVKDWIKNENINNPMAVNYGALYCIQQCADLLLDHGHILVNDYGPVTGEEISQKISYKRFGRTLAMDINFPVFDFCIAHMGLESIKSSIDDTQSLHSRLITKNKEVYSEYYEEHFGEEFFNLINTPLSNARDSVNKSSLREAQYFYLQALAADSSDWFMIAEIAEFFVVHKGDAQAALPLIKKAVEMNPWYSTWLWDILGDCLFALNRIEDGVVAYRQAISINPKDSASNLRMASYFELNGKYEEALTHIAIGLAHDKKGSQSSHLLELQARIVNKIT